MISPNLSFILLFPTLIILILFLIPADKTILIRRLSIIGTVVPSLISLWTYIAYDYTAGGFQFIQKIEWVKPLGISYHIGVDGINSVLLLLLSIVSFVAIYISKSVKERIKEYYIFLLIAIAGTYGTFLSLDIFFFFFFHEVATIPIFLLIAIWGSARREEAAIKLTLYLIAGAAIALIGLIGLYFATGLQTFDFLAIQQHLINNPIPSHLQHWIFPFIVVGFGITLTLWPFHTWAPIGYAEAPTAVSMMHSGVLKKMGACAIIRFACSLMPEAAHTWMPIIATLAVINIIFCGLIALTQRDIKYILGYSSCSHMGYILLGLACFNVIGLNGVVFLMFAHGIMAALAFCLVGYITDQTKTRNLDQLGGIIKAMPFIGTCFIMVAFASAGVPGFANFVAELMVLLAAWDQYRWLTVFAALGIVITAIYMLKTIRLGFQGPLNPSLPALTDAKTPFEKLPFILLMAVLIIVGFWPQLIISHIGSSTKPIAERLQ